jgi:FecR protein
MTPRIKKIIVSASLAVATVCVMGVLPALATGLAMESTHRSGLGRPVGIVQQVQGEVIIVHDDVLKGYRAERGIRLYKGDTIRTLEKGRLRIRLNDGSIISLASKTKIKLTRSVYEKKKKRRSSFFSMALGKARFFVVKMLEFKRSEFKVKTPTAVCGVRGSDFILEATGTETIATALADTELEFQSLAFLEEPPVILRDFQESTTGLNKRPSSPMQLPQDRIDQKKGEFIDVAPQKGTVKDDDAVGQDQVADDTGVDEAGDLGDKMDLEDVRPGDFGEDKEYSDFENNIKPWTPTEFDTIKETITEDIVGGELPEFPETP